MAATNNNAGQQQQQQQQESAQQQQQQQAAPAPADKSWWGKTVDCITSPFAKGLATGVVVAAAAGYAYSKYSESRDNMGGSQPQE